MSAPSLQALMECIADKFAQVENLTTRVGVFFLNPREAKVLRAFDGFDKVNPLVTEHDPQPGTLIGSLWGADVRELIAAPDGHIAIFPDDVKLLDIGPAAFTSLGLHLKEQRGVTRPLDATPPQAETPR